MGLRRLSENMKKPELLAPAGDLKRCRTAIRYGADAVYIGGRSFSLRSRASNFTMDDIREACAFAREHGSVIHVTVNIIPHEEDFDGLREYLRNLQDAGVHAVIVASPAIMKLAREAAPKLEIHCSTQLSVTNADAARFFRDQLHADRVVLARECTMSDIRKITAVCEAQTEAFIHGGMCVNYSGRCTLSNRMTLRDANRGGCAQSCRWLYHLYEKDRELSDEDLLTIGSRDLMCAEWIWPLMEAGVSSFKIEGRMKTEYYVASIVSAYRHLIDEIYENRGPLSDERMAYHRRQIMFAENRQTCDGFYAGRADEKSLIYHMTSNADVNHDFLGTVRKYSREKGTAMIETRNLFSLNETVQILSPYGIHEDFRITSIKDAEGGELDVSRRPMVTVEIPVPFEVYEEDILRRVRP